ncbi:MAG: MarR family transcriptional regulator [Polyangiaceae bacterium]|nr:MarR family transcriptional regulator [Polyangiaceae bacterium]
MTSPVTASRDHVWQRLVALVLDNRWDWRRKMSDAAGLPFSRVRALDRLHHGPLTLRALGEVIGADPPATTVIVNDLEARGLVVREAHPEDKRAKVVSLTAEGRRLVRAVRSAKDKAPPEFAALSDKDVTDLLRIVERLGGE